MTRSRDEAPFEKKLAQFTVRLSDKDEMRLLRIANESGIPAAVLCRIWVLKGIAKSSSEDGLADNLSSSDFAPLGDS